VTEVDHTELEINLFLNAMKQVHGYDFTSYAGASISRRVLHLRDDMGLEHVSSLIPKAVHDQGFLEHAVSTLTVSVSELFRDPEVFKLLRQEVVSYLETFPKIDIWIAGCASGEEAYSIAILLQEEGLLERSQIYATDICLVALEHATSGILREKLTPDDARRYQEAGGTGSLSDYFTTMHGFSKLRGELLSHISFQQHDMIKESAFVTPQLLMCRNVLIYFNKSLQEQVLKKFRQCLNDMGFLVIGPKENLSLSDQFMYFNIIDDKTKVHQKRPEND
jgi:chemotaxis protein methyltransferase CheR